MSLYVQLLKAKGIVVTRENSSYIKVAENELAFCSYKAILGKMELSNLKLVNSFLQPTGHNVSPEVRWAIDTYTCHIGTRNYSQDLSDHRCPRLELLQVQHPSQRQFCWWRLGAPMSCENAGGSTCMAEKKRSYNRERRENEGSDDSPADFGPILRRFPAKHAKSIKI